MERDCCVYGKARSVLAWIDKQLKYSMHAYLCRIIQQVLIVARAIAKLLRLLGERAVGGRRVENHTISP